MALSELLWSGRLDRRRTRVLATALSALLPDGCRLLDVGCGSGEVANLIQAQRADITVVGVDVLVRSDAAIPVTRFDGLVLPFPDDAFDIVSLVDVLHHAYDPEQLLAEAKRVARQGVLVKDHRRDGPLAGTTLRIMDWTGNAHHGVALPYMYWREDEWRATFSRLGLKIDVWQTRLGIYPWPISLVCDRSLHFLARLRHA